jgi:hypothetical protein
MAWQTRSAEIAVWRERCEGLSWARGARDGDGVTNTLLHELEWGTYDVA